MIEFYFGKRALLPLWINLTYIWFGIFGHVNPAVVWVFLCLVLFCQSTFAMLSQCHTGVWQTCLSLNLTVFSFWFSSWAYFSPLLLFVRVPSSRVTADCPLKSRWKWFLCLHVLKLTSESCSWFSLLCQGCYTYCVYKSVTGWKKKTKRYQNLWRQSAGCCCCLECFSQWAAFPLLLCLLSDFRCRDKVGEDSGR